MWGLRSWRRVKIGTIAGAAGPAAEKAGDPSEASLQAAMALAWADLHHTRRQTWEALKLEALIAAGLVGLRFVPNSNSLSLTALAVLGGLLLFLLAIAGAQITFHHRDIEIQKFEQIVDIQNRLNLGTIFAATREPAPVNWGRLRRIRESNTALYVARMHVAIALFSLVLIGTSAGLYAADHWPK
jgi:hypothetical protein